MLGSLLHKVLQGIFLILFLAGVVLSAAGAMAVANQRAQSLQSLFALERDLTAPIGELGQIKEKSRAHMTGVDRSAARQRAAFRLLVLSAPAALAGFLGLAAYTGAHLRRRPKLTERDAIWKLRRTEQYALGLLVVGLALVAFGSSSYLQSAREHATAAGEGIALARRLADAE
ncbi:MAG: hypothetical protein JXB04_11400, partial [Kiritimatiellae bacterium]|nr:hypothetical protein [Kiritimatiellia bacterium]